jgi:GAF domain-containing protein
MKFAGTPKNEAQRLEALKRYNLLDTKEEQSFDDLTLLASQLCQKPIAMISLVDEYRQWFKSKIGIAAKETPRDISFCSHAILNPEVFIVSDTSKDDRFFDNPLVTGDPFIRFYAGAPLYSVDGFALGTICVIDTKPGSITEEQINGLEALSRLTSALIEQRRTLVELHEAVGTIKLISGIVPICATCKKIRDEHNHWITLEKYIQERSDAQFSHGVCPECAKKILNDYYNNSSKE